MKPVSKCAGALVLAGLLAGTFLQQTSLSRLRAENQQLLDQSKEAQRLTRQNADVERLRQENAEAQRLRYDTAELHRLRNEVRQLRQRKPDLDAIQVENRRLRAAPGPATGSTAPAPDAPLVAREALGDAGLTSPEAAMQTFFWAIRERNAQRIRACFSDEGASKLRDQSDQEILEGAGHMMDTFKGFQIVARKAVSADEVKLGIRITAEGATPPQEMALGFKRVGNEWKLSMGF